MRTLIFSDTHLTHDYDPGLDHFLQSLIARADRVIVNGDFWDGFHTTWELFAESQWQSLFSLLRQKKAVILWGNHDLPGWTKDPTLLGDQYIGHYVLPLAKYELLISHGHEIAPSFDAYFPYASWYLGQYVPYRSYSYSPNTWWNRRGDWLLRQHAQTLSPHQVMVAGHTHVAAMDSKIHYANSGVIHNGKATWLWIENDRLSLHQGLYDNQI